MGRGKIRRRTKKGRLVREGRKRSQRPDSSSYQEPDVIGDLEDQAMWSSYTQDIPRLGNEYRESLRLNRIYRFYSGVVKPSGKVFGREPTWITKTIGLLIGVGLLVWFVYSAIRIFVP